MTVHSRIPEHDFDRHIEQELRDSQAHLAGIVASAMDAIITVNQQQMIVLFNASAEKMFGFPAEQALGKPLDILIPERYRSIHRKRILQFGKTGTTNRTMGHLNTLFGLRSDGSEFPIEASISQVHTTNGHLFSVILRDITARVAAEDQIKESTQHMQATFDQAAIGIAHVSPDGKMVRVNEKLCEISGYEHDVLCTKTVSDLTHEEDLEKELSLMAALLSGETNSYSLEKRYRRQDGSYIWVKVTSSLVRDPYGAPKYLIKLIEDISPRIKAEDALKKNAKKIKALNEQTVKRLHRLSALRTIDLAISSSLDLRITLGIILEQVTNELGMDAADVLLLDPLRQTLDYTAGRGFITTIPELTSILLGTGLAGASALDQKTVHVPDISNAPPEFIRRELFDLEQVKSYFVTPLVAKGEAKGVLEVFHRTNFEPDAEWLSFFEALAGQAAIAIDSAQLFFNLQRSNQQLLLAYNSTIEGWSRALDLRDKETEGHTRRVTEMTLRLAHAMETTFSDEEIVHIQRGALLHDIGKMGVPDHILLKPGELTDEEWVVMRRHPGYAYQLLYPIVYLRQALDIPYYHHERWDGSGYPHGLKQEQIPLSARIFAVADVWDALRSDRPYRAGWPEARVQDYIKDRVGVDFDPQVVDLFMETTRRQDDLRH